MRQILLILSLMLLGLTWAVAQNEGATQSGQKGQSASGQTTVEGCLTGSNGNFTLTDKNGMSYQLAGDTAKLSEHVGHEVKVTGMPSSGAAGGEGASAGTGATQTLQVSSIKHISKTCKSGGGMAH
jgi:Protein of unknown function (DUF5818)